ncbi:MAG: hypothetical protein BJ554DRAFT_6785 [Olpidium bornovanus]|uniref:Uncharacterized protein n=1 Tax=Olpidium bornovanus TaxID=278681 RepID=A0A8H7ZX26_9FUNG|nr:MAG: hypothetical protein BJ554DRAFT_6785 [Olpidium bornovanus]
MRRRRKRRRTLWSCATTLPSSAPRAGNHELKASNEKKTSGRRKTRALPVQPRGTRKLPTLSSKSPRVELCCRRKPAHNPRHHQREPSRSATRPRRA